jgi:predicted transcriptional regulator
MDESTFQTVSQELEAFVSSSELTMTDMITLSGDTRMVLNWMMRQNRFQAHELAEFVGQSRTVVNRLVSTLTTKGFLAVEWKGLSKYYHIQIKSSRTPRPPTKIWTIFDD